MIETEKKAIVAANLQLSDQESSAFWPVYNDYQDELRKVSDRRIALLETRKSWVKKFEKVLSKRKVARYYQIENKLQAIIDYELASKVPLVR